MTLAYMEAVRAGKVYCPKYEQVRLRPCLIPPPVKKLLAWIEQELQIQRAYHPERPVQLGFPPNKLPDVQWALVTLATIQPNHRIFGKGYVAEPREVRPQFGGAIVNNADGFFDGLPPRQGKPARRTVLKKPPPSAAEKQHKLARLLAAKAKLDRQLLEARGEHLGE